MWLCMEKSLCPEMQNDKFRVSQKMFSLGIRTKMKVHDGPQMWFKGQLVWTTIVKFN